MLHQNTLPMDSQSEALASFTHYIEYYGEQVGSMEILGTLITDVASMIEKRLAYISDTYFGCAQSFGVTNRVV